MRLLLAILIALIAQTSVAMADPSPTPTPTPYKIALNPLLSHNMVLQQGSETLLNGIAAAGAHISVSWPCYCGGGDNDSNCAKDQCSDGTVTPTPAATAGSDGKWTVKLDLSMKTDVGNDDARGKRLRIHIDNATGCADVGPFAFDPAAPSYYKGRPKDSNGTAVPTPAAAAACDIDIDGVMVGEVWLCSGQSNLSEAWVAGNGEQASAFPFIRSSAGQGYDHVRATFPDNGAPPVAINGGAAGWSEPLTPTPASRHDEITLGCWSFAVQLHTRLRSAVGILERSVQETDISRWEGDSICVDQDDMKYLVVPHWGYASCDEQSPYYKNWGDLYKAKIKPLWPYTFKGVFWWQGQEDLNFAVEPEDYAHSLPALVRSWRKDRHSSICGTNPTDCVAACGTTDCTTDLLPPSDLPIIWSELPKGRNIMNHQAEFLAETAPTPTEGPWACLPTPAAPENTSKHFKEDRMRAAYVAGYFGNSGTFLSRPAPSPSQAPLRRITPAPYSYHVISSDLDAAEPNLIAGDPRPGTKGSHPNDQALYGQRYAWVALSQIYDDRDAWSFASWSGPYLDAMSADGRTARLFFRPGTAEGMVGFTNPGWSCPAPSLHGFACYDGEWRLADAHVCGNQIEVTCPTPPAPTPVNTPSALRYNRSDVGPKGRPVEPYANVFNGDSMALMPFIIDWETHSTSGVFPPTAACPPTSTPAPCTPVATATPTPACVGDCGGIGEVSADDVITLVQLALGAPVEQYADTCPQAYEDDDGTVTVNGFPPTIDNIIIAINYALNGCPGSGGTPLPQPPAVGSGSGSPFLRISPPIRTKASQVAHFYVSLLSAKAQAVSVDLAAPASLVKSIVCCQNCLHVKPKQTPFEQMGFLPIPPTPTPSPRYGHRLRASTPVPTSTPLPDSTPEESPEGWCPANSTCLRTLIFMDQASTNVPAFQYGRLLSCYAKMNDSAPVIGIHDPQQFVQGLRARVVKPNGSVADVAVTPARIRIAPTRGPSPTAVENVCKNDGCPDDTFEHNYNLARAAEEIEEYEGGGEDPGGSGCAVDPTHAGRGWGSALLAIVPIWLWAVRRRGRKPGAISITVFILLSAAPASAGNLPFGSGLYTVLRPGTPDPRVVDDVTDSDTGGDHSWEAYDFEPYGTELIAQLLVSGSSFIGAGAIDVALGSDGVVLGELYLPEGDWVAHLEGEIIPDGLEAYVLAGNGEIDEVVIFSPGIASAFSVLVNGTPTPTATSDGADTATPTPTPTAPTSTPTATNTSTPLPTATPTATPPEGCEYFTLTPSEEYFTLATGQDGPIEPLWCSNDYPLLPVINVTDTNPTSATTVQTHVVLRWDNSSVPSNLTAVKSWLRLTVDSAAAASSSEAADRSLRADWYTAEGDPCAPADYASGSADALSTDSECGAACDLANVIVGMRNDFPLNEPAAHVDSGSVALRLWVPNGDSPVANHLLAAASDPLLIVLACERAPTPSPTPTATLTPRPDGCQVLIENLSANDEAVASGESFPPEFQSCGGTPQTAETSWIEASDTFERRTLLYSWNALDFYAAFFSSPESLPYLPLNMVVRHAWLRLTPLETWNADGLSLVGDWRHWGCDANDDTVANAATALSTSGVCGAACNLDRLTTDEPVYLSLDDPDARILRGEATYLRLQVSGTPSAGRNGLTVADGTDTEHDAPQLVMLLCPPSPTPTPEPGCHVDAFVSDANGWTAWASGSTYPPAFDHCENDLFVRFAGLIYINLPGLGSGYIGGNTLFAWDTSSLPEGAVVDTVSIKAFVAADHTDAAASFTADWYDWGESCGEEDYDENPGLGNAMSVEGACANACWLPNIPLLRQVTFPLDDAAAHLSYSSEVPVKMRIRVDHGETPGSPSVGMADVSSMWPPQLVVRWCEADHTPGPTPLPTPTPVVGSCELSEGCAAGTWVEDVTEVDCVMTAWSNDCSALNWSPSVPASNIGCCVSLDASGSEMCRRRRRVDVHGNDGSRVPRDL